MENLKPKVFIGSSFESIEIARAIQDNLANDVEATVWDQGVFNVSNNFLDSIIGNLNSCDFGIFVFTADDIAKIRADEMTIVRDNVLFESGLYIGKLGKSRTFIVRPYETKKFHMPTDLLGLAVTTYDHNRTDNLVAALGSCCNIIRRAIRSQGSLRGSTKNMLNIPGLISATPSRTPGDRVNSIYKIIENIKGKTELLILGRSLIDWTNCWNKIEDLINEKCCTVRIALLSEKYRKAIETPSNIEWAFNDVGISMGNIRRIKLKNSTGRLEVYGLPFYLPHSFIAYTNTENKRICIEEAGMGLERDERPYFEFLDANEGKDSFVKSLEKMYGLLFKPDRLLIYDDGSPSNKYDVLFERKPPNSKLPITQYKDDKIIDEHARILKILSKWNNHDLLRGPWLRIITEKSLPIFNHLRNEIPLRSYQPVSAHFEVTDYCNGRCNYCQRWTWQNTTKYSLPVALKIIEKIASLGVDTLTIGGGEPFTFPGIDKVLLHGDSLGLRLGLITNGLHISNESMEIACSTLQWIRFSIDGHDDFTYKKVRNIEGGFDRVISNIKRVIETRGQKKLPLIGTNYILQKQNIDSLVNFINYASASDIDMVLFKLVHGVPDYSPSEVQLKSLESEIRGMSIGNSNLAEFTKMLFEDFNMIDIQSGYPTKGFYEKKNYRCFVPFFFLTIDPNGQLYPCDYLYFDTRNQGEYLKQRDGYSLGSIFDLTLGSLNSSKWANVVKSIHNINAENIKECGCCTRFYRFNALMTELFEEYERLVDEKGPYLAESIYKSALLLNTNESQNAWL